MVRFRRPSTADSAIEGIAELRLFRELKNAAWKGCCAQTTLGNVSGEVMSFTKLAIAGVSSEVGKTTLLCELLREFPGWEAIKMTRGHYRSCGKDPHACCVSHLLGDEPLVRSGFRETYASDKDTGRYWDAGAANVHWVIVTNGQVERGIELALERVRAPGVLIEGNSFLQFIDVDFGILVTGGADTKIKSSARWAFQKASAVYLFDQTTPGDAVDSLNNKFGPLGLERSLPTYPTDDFPRLVERINQIHALRSDVATLQNFRGEPS
ncbi:MAG: hypothetical protein QOJ64_65 [Acidobacteriota bacterium]|jgi:hypothetical protein|nr:hypothetical protein [Acidobacteriota bacterium]